MRVEPAAPFRRLAFAQLALALALPIVPAALAQEAAVDFKTNCMSCHTIGGGRLVGPDLKDVSQRKERAWLSRFIVDPAAVLASGDAYALRIQSESRGVVMPNVPGMSLDRAQAILDLIVAESALEKSQFAGVQISERPFTRKDVQRGRESFLGMRRLTEGGPACVSCHSVKGIGVLAGGGLAPELSAVYERLSGRKGLATWLSAPATTTMQSVYENQPMDATADILPLLAYFADLAQDPPESSQASTLIFILLGLAGAAATLMIFDVLWKGRFRGVRKALVESSRQAEV
jgi:mono/diheme cytochrome c family protein